MQRKLTRIHLIDKAHDVYPMCGHMPGATVDRVFVTTWWRMNEDSAKSCVGAEVHLHEAQNLESYQAGICTGYFPLESGYGLMFVDDPALAGRVQAEVNWAQVQARVYSSP